MAKRRGKALAALIATVVVLVCLAAALWIWYLLDRRDPFEYLPGSFTAYVQLTSLRSAYDDWIGQESMERAIAAAGFSQVRKGIIDIRGMQASKSPFLRSLMDVRADLAILKGGAVLGALSLGPRSLVTRVAPVLGPFLSVKGLSFIKESDFSSFEYDLGGVKIYAAPAGDLLIVSTDRKALQTAFASRGADDRLSARTDIRTLSALSGAARGIRFLVDSRDILSPPLSWLPAGKKALESLDFASESVVDARALNGGISLDLELPIASRLRELDEVLASSGGRSRLLPILPPEASFCFGIHVRELSLLFDALCALEPSIHDAIAKGDAAAKVALGYGFDDFIYSWAGGEAAVVQSRGSKSPILCLAIEDEKLRAERFGKALALPIFAPTEQDFDGARLTKIAFPWWVKVLLDAAKVEIADPYIAVESGFLFASQDPDALASVINGIRGGERIRDDPGWKPAFPESSSSPLLYCLYDSGTKPFFLGEDWAFTSILREFGRGVLEVFPSRDGLSASLVALQAPEDATTRSAYGFPMRLGESVDSLAVLKFKGTGSPRVAVFGAGKLRILDPASPERLVEAEAPKGSRAAAGESSLLWSVADSGEVRLWNAKGETVAPFPLERALSKMPPLALENGLLVGSVFREGLSLLDASGAEKPFGPLLQDPVLSRPAARNGLIAFATKGFDSLVYLTDGEGTVRPGWPVEGGGISFGSPDISSDDAGALVAFLTQAGELGLWTADGKSRDEFPFKLEGPFRASPVICSAGRQRLAACANEAGAISVVSEYGALLSSYVLPEAAGKLAVLTAADRDEDGSDELYVSGNANVTFAFSLPGLELLPGYPVPGGLGPFIADIDNDGALDTVTASRDGTIYAR